MPVYAVFFSLFFLVAADENILCSVLVALSLSDVPYKIETAVGLAQHRNERIAQLGRDYGSNQSHDSLHNSHQHQLKFLALKVIALRGRILFWVFAFLFLFCSVSVGFLF